MFFRRHARTLAGFVLLALFLSQAIPGLRLDLIDALERKAYDLRLKATAPGGVDDRVVIADIDEKSLSALGHWPWKRDVLARLMDTLFDHYQVKVVGFDMVFAEPDDSQALSVLRELAQGPLRGDAAYTGEYRRRAAALDTDARFAQSLAERNTVLGFVFLKDSTVRRNGQPPALVEVPVELQSQLPVVKPAGWVSALPALQEKARLDGFFDNPSLDEDGIFRRIPLLQMTDKGLHPSLALAVTYLALDGAPVNIDVHENRGYLAIENVQVGPHVVPVDAQTNLLVPYRGPRNSFPYLSIADILDRKIPVEELKGRIVLVGTSAPGLLDLRTTPLDNVYPGVEVHANVIAGILDDNVRSQPAWTVGAEFIELLALGLVMLFLAARLGPLLQAVLSLALAGLAIAVNLWAWSAGFVLPLASALLLVAVLFMYLMSYGYFVESRGKRDLARLFGQYVPPELVDEMAANPEAISLEGRSKELTVLFSDVRSFTTISEGLEPKELSALMNAYLTAMTRVIHRHRGTIDKYMGDAIMAFWGAPVDDPQHARHALEAALDMAKELETLRADFRTRGWPPINIGIGLNTGTMNVGNMGSSFRMAYTVMGDAVNLGSRLEGLSKQYGATIVVSEFTRDAVPDYVYRRLDCVRVKGKDKPVMIFEPIGPRSAVSAEEIERLDRLAAAQDCYCRQEWDVAEHAFKALITEDDRKLYHLYIDRIEHFRQEPPEPDWDGVYTHETK